MQLGRKERNVSQGFGRVSASNKTENGTNIVARSCTEILSGWRRCRKRKDG